MKNIELLQAAVADTAGTSMTLSPTDKGWQSYIVQQKKKFENASISLLCKEVAEWIIANRIPKETVANSKKAGANKPFKMK